MDELVIPGNRQASQIDQLVSRWWDPSVCCLGRHPHRRSLDACESWIDTSLHSASPRFHWSHSPDPNTDSKPSELFAPVPALLLIQDALLAWLWYPWGKWDSPMWRATRGKWRQTGVTSSPADTIWTHATVKDSDVPKRVDDSWPIGDHS